MNRWEATTTSKKSRSPSRIRVMPPRALHHLLIQTSLSVLLVLIIMQQGPGTYVPGGGKAHAFPSGAHLPPRRGGLSRPPRGAIGSRLFSARLYGGASPSPGPPNDPPRTPPPPPNHRNGLGSSSSPPDPPPGDGCSDSHPSFRRASQDDDEFEKTTSGSGALLPGSTSSREKDLNGRRNRNRSKALPKLRVVARGGASSSSAENVVKGTQATLANAVSFWSRQFQSLSSRLVPRRRNKRINKEEELLRQLQTMPVQRIRVPNTTVLPADVVQVAAKRTQLLGNALRMDRVQDFASTIAKWYRRNGFILHSVTGATLLPESATADIAVVEPKVHRQPVNILFVKEMVVDTTVAVDDDDDAAAADSGAEGSSSSTTRDSRNSTSSNSRTQLLTYRQYKDKYEKHPSRRRTLGGSSDSSIRKEDLNITLVETTGRMKSSVVARALGLRPGMHFCWDPSRWQNVARSRVFSKIWQARPAPMTDGTVQLQLVVQEAPLRHLEYGVGKSLYTNSWEGELEFEHLNLLGGGETLGLVVKRGTSEAQPSGKLTFGNAKFGNPGGYELQLFRDFLGKRKHSNKNEKGKETPGAAAATNSAPEDSESTALGSNAGSSENSEIEIPTIPGVAADAVGLSGKGDNMDQAGDASSSASTIPATMDPFLDRKGLSFRIRNPLPQRICLNSAASATLERTSTFEGLHENICSTTLSLGPFVRRLPFDARSNVDARLTTGTRVSLVCVARENARSTSSSENERAQPSSAPTPAPTSVGSESFWDRTQFLPYSTITASTKQIFPLTQSSSSVSSPSSSSSFRRPRRRPVLLALRHSVSASSRYTPEYEARALGNLVNIRGAEPNGSVKSCLRGTTELRIPIRLPDVTKLLPRRSSPTGITEPALPGSGAETGVAAASSAAITTASSSALSVPEPASLMPSAAEPFSRQEDANVVLFGDWLVAAQDASTPLFRKTSVGIGLRKSIQGIPLSLDLTYSKELKIKTSFGLGRDFDV